MIPAILLSIYAQMRVQSTYSKYSGVVSSSRLSGAAVARQILTGRGLSDVRVEMTQGTLSDHYDPRARVLRLSPGVYNGNSLAALGVAAHETGHALQHDEGYVPLQLRTSFLPLASIGSMAAFPLLIIGILMASKSVAMIGVYAFTLVVLFYLITLPVEFNASNRALALLADGGYLTRNEIEPTRAVLNAAALTYVAAALTAVLNLVRLLLLAGMFGGRDE